ncbi:MAG: hypothetical protein MZV49_09390 [Rhodopseudomonas palustris]|nr:hypothetical protein [Rhodopseudomonas palustris]
MSDRAWFVYANGIRDDAPFDDVLRFRTKLIPYDGNATWVEPALRAVADCLAIRRSSAGIGRLPVLRLRATRLACRLTQFGVFPSCRWQRALPGQVTTGAGTH